MDLEIEEVQQEAWKLKAECRGFDPAIFFPAPADAEGLKYALSICEGCPVKEECLEANLWERDGVWGATSAKRRKRIRAEREDKTRSCMWCGKQFKPSNPQVKMCSDECRKISRKRAKEKCVSSGKKGN